MTGMSTMSDEQRQLHRWVMDLANYLSEEKGVSRSAALHKAHLTKALLQALGEGEVTFTYLKKDGTIVINTQEILPMPVITGATTYPADCLARVEEAAKAIEINAVEIAHECGTYRAANVVLMGVLAKTMPFSAEEWKKAITSCVKPKFLDMNLAAFDRGYNY